MEVEDFVLAQYEGLFRSSGHRVNTLNDGFREVGIGTIIEVYTSSDTDWDAQCISRSTCLVGAIPTHRRDA